MTAKLPQIMKRGLSSNRTWIKVKLFHPYDITLNDNFGIKIKNSPIEGRKLWEHYVKNKKKFDFVDGIINNSSEELVDQKNWWTINSLLVSWIRNTIKPSCFICLYHIQEVEKLGTNNKKYFVVVNGSQMQQLKAKLAEYKQMGIIKIDYYDKLIMLYEEFVNYEKILTCKCENCTRNLRAISETKKIRRKGTSLLWWKLKNDAWKMGEKSCSWHLQFKEDTPIRIKVRKK